AIVLESPRAGALFRLCNPRLATAIASLSTPQRLDQLRKQNEYPGDELLALLVTSRIVVVVEEGGGTRLAEGDHSLALWDFHDLLFHARSTAGRHANPVGGYYPYAGVIAPLPAVRPSWSGEKIALGPDEATEQGEISHVAKLLRERQSTRLFD